MSSAINVPIKARTHELNQLHGKVPEAVDHFQQAEMHDEADEVNRIYDEHISGVDPKFTDDDQSFAAYVYMPADDWYTTLRVLGRFDDQRLWWLRKKLSKRLRDRLDEMEDE